MPKASQASVTPHKSDASNRLGSSSEPCSVTGTRCALSWRDSSFSWQFCQLGGLLLLAPAMPELR